MAETNVSKKHNWKDYIPGIIISLIISLALGSAIASHFTIDKLYDILTWDTEYMKMADDTIEKLNQRIEEQDEEIETLEQKIDALEGSDNNSSSVTEPHDSYSVSF